MKQLSKDMLSWEPVRIVNSSPCCINIDNKHGFPPASVATLELSNLDLFYDYYESALLFYDIQATQCSLLQYDDPVTRLQRALEELLVHYPSAAGLLVYNETAGRFEVRYPALFTSCPSAAPSPGPSFNGSLLPNVAQHHVQISPSNGFIHSHRAHLSDDALLSDLSNHLSQRPACQLTSKDNIQYSSSKPPMSHCSNDHCAESPWRFGVQFHVAHANVTLSDLGDVSDPQPSLDLLFPSIPTEAYDAEGRPLVRFVMAFQVTTFECGSFTVAHTCSHLYADGYTAATFLQNLCSIARGAGLANPPDFSHSRRMVFSARDPPAPTMQFPFIDTRKISANGEQAATYCTQSKQLHYGPVTRFVFSTAALEALRVKASLKPDQLRNGNHCSRTQALMALLWTAYARVRLKVQGRARSEEMTLRFPMNLRKRSFGCCNAIKVKARYVGNALYQCSVRATVGELSEGSLGEVVERIKRSTAVGGMELAEAVQSLVDDVEVKVREGLVPVMGGGSLGMPTHVGLSFHDMDCGWGLPVYVGRPSQQLGSRCTIVEHPSAHAWNVLAVFSSPEERSCFEEAIALHL